MRTQLILLLAVSTLAACTTRRKLQYTESRKANTSDTLRVTVKETIRYDTVRLAGGMVTVVQKVPCDPQPPKGGMNRGGGLVGGDTNQGKGLVNGARTKAEGPTGADTTKSGHVTLIVTNLGNGKQRIDCKADSLIAVLAGKDKLIETYRASNATDTKVVTQTKVVTKYRTAWWWYLIPIGYIAWLCRNPLINLWQKLKQRRANGTAY